MRKILLNEMYAWCLGRPQCACHHFSQINTLMNGPWTGTGVALLASQQPANTIGDSAYWQWGVLAWTKGEPNEIWACVCDKWEWSRLTGTWGGFCSFATLPWRDEVRVWRLFTAGSDWSCIGIYSQVQQHFTTQVKAPYPITILLQSLFS